MTPRDSGNLAFIMACDLDSLGQWYEGLSEQDREYALELLMKARQEFTTKAVMMHDALTGAHALMTDSTALLMKFRLGR